MTMKVYLDIETLPPDRSDSAIVSESGSGTEEDFRRLALNPHLGRILCIGIIIEQDNQITSRGVLGRCRETGEFHLDESRTLRSFWNLLKSFDTHRDLLIGFNLLDFDLHFLCQRSVIKRVKPTFKLCFARFRSQPVFDVMWEFEHWRHRISLDEVAKVLGLQSSKQDGVNGGAVYDLFNQHRHEEIAAYCMKDVELTRSIYYRMNFFEESE